MEHSPYQMSPENSIQGALQHYRQKYIDTKHKRALISPQSTSTVSESSQRSSRVIQHQKKIKKSLILKRKSRESPTKSLSKSLIVPKLYLLGGLIVLNENSIKYPQLSHNSLILNSLHFNRITSLIVNDQYMALNLKKNQDINLTHQYMIDRFRSLNDSMFKQLAVNLENIAIEEEYAKQRIQNLRFKMGNDQFMEKLNQMRQGQQNIVQNLLLNKYKDHKYVAFYFSEGVEGMILSKLYVSTHMLAFTDNKLEDFIQTYVQEKTLSFELIGTSAYQKVFLEDSKHTVEALRKRRLENQDEYKFCVEQDHRICESGIDMPSYIYRKRQKNGVQWQEKLKCQMRFCKPRLSLKLFLFGEADSYPITV